MWEEEKGRKKEIMEYRKYIELVMNNGVKKVYWTSKGIMEYRKFIGLVME